MLSYKYNCETEQFPEVMEWISKIFEFDGYTRINAEAGLHVISKDSLRME